MVVYKLGVAMMIFVVIWLILWARQLAKNLRRISIRKLNHDSFNNSVSKVVILPAGQLCDEGQCFFPNQNNVLIHTLPKPLLQSYSNC